MLYLIAIASFTLGFILCSILSNEQECKHCQQKERPDFSPGDLLK